MSEKGSDHEQRIEHVFLVRMWLERDSTRSQWRGSVQHVASGRRLFVGSPGEVSDFITVQLPKAERTSKPAD